MVDCKLNKITLDIGTCNVHVNVLDYENEDTLKIEWRKEPQEISVGELNFILKKILPLIRKLKIDIEDEVDKQ